jgi:hypothetical protein
MPVQRQKSSLAARLGDKARAAFEKKKTEEPQYDSQAGLPAGIEGGVARLVECKFMSVAAGKQNAGKDMFYAAGVVVSPREINGVSLVGLRTQISEPIYDTPTRTRKGVDDHVEWVMNEMKKLGIDMSEMTIDDLEDIAVTLKEQGPYFRFRTWSGSKLEIEKRGGKFFVGTKGPYATEQQAKTANPYAGSEPMVNHVWNGACEYIEDEEDSGVVDQTEESPAKSAKATMGKKHVKPEPEPEPDVEAEGEPSEDLSELAGLADGGDQDAATRLSELAMQAGVGEEVISDAESWASVVEMMQDDGEPQAEEAEEEAADEWKPEKGEVYAYKAPGKRTAVDCEVTAVFEGKQTVNLRNLTDEKIYKSVPWDKLVK